MCCRLSRILLLFAKHYPAMSDSVRRRAGRSLPSRAESPWRFSRPHFRL